MITSNVIFSGCSDGTVFDFKNNNNGLIGIKYSNDTSNTVKFENIIFKNFGENMNRKNYMFSVISYSDKNYLKFENCTFTDIRYIIFDVDISNNKEYNDISYNSDYFITFINCNF